MKILLVCDLFPPDKGVSTQRVKYFYDRLTSNYQVDVLKSGNKNKLEGTIMEYDTNLLSSFIKTISRRLVIKKIFSRIFDKYDLVIVSVPRFHLLEFAKISLKKGIKTIIDIRDLPNLVVVEKTVKQPLLKNVWQLINFIQFKYILDIAKTATAILTVGSISTALIQNKLINHKHIINVHNGFMPNDININITKATSLITQNTFEIGIAGTIHNFRYSKDLIEFIEKLNAIIKNNPKIKIIIKHWGTLKETPFKLFKSLNGVEYQHIGFKSREIYLTELANCDLFVLACSDFLIWEPTTTVFDYILYDKPVLFLGLKNNEAHIILENSGSKIIYLNELEDFFNHKEKYFSENDGNKTIYSREYGYKKLEKFIKSIFS